MLMINIFAVAKEQIKVLHVMRILQSGKTIRHQYNQVNSTNNDIT